jgi:hypothetical protein
VRTARFRCELRVVIAAVLRLGALLLMLRGIAFSTDPTLEARQRPRLAKMSPKEREAVLAENLAFLEAKRSNEFTPGEEARVEESLWFVSELSTDPGDARLCNMFTNASEWRVAIRAGEACIRIEHRRVTTRGGAFNLPNSILQVWQRPFGGKIGKVLRDLKPPGSPTILRHWYAKIQPAVLSAQPLIHLQGDVDLSIEVNRAFDLLETLGICGGAADRLFAGEHARHLLEAFASEERVASFQRRRFGDLSLMIAEARSAPPARANTTADGGARIVAIILVCALVSASIAMAFVSRARSKSA